jgi:hypothetical protein
MSKALVVQDKQPIPEVDTRVARHILLLRGERVLLDIHLAELYDVETRTLKQAVRRNKHRFPPDFMFTLKVGEIDELVANGFIASAAHLGGAKPFAFTEGGVAMLSSVLNSKKAIAMNIAIMRTFVALRKAARSYSAIMAKLKELEGKTDKRFKEVYDLIAEVIGPAKPPRKRIGYKKDVIR